MAQVILDLKYNLRYLMGEGEEEGMLEEVVAR